MLLWYVNTQKRCHFKPQLLGFLRKSLISTLIDSFSIKGKALRRDVDGCEHGKYG